MVTSRRRYPECSSAGAWRDPAPHAARAAAAGRGAEVVGAASCGGGRELECVLVNFSSVKSMFNL